MLYCNPFCIDNMKTAKQLCLTLFLLAVFAIRAHATWSIIAIDSKTGEIGIAGASCTYSVYGIGAIVPGKGAIVVQAMSNPLARLKGLKMIIADAPPEEILAAMKDPDFDPEEQQYAVLCVKYLEKPQTYTGSEAPPEKGTLTQNGVTVQGNTLAGSQVLQAVMTAAIKAQQDGLSIADVLMLALEAGATAGGDKRCGDRKASSAFLTVAKPDDDPHHPSLNLIVYGNDDNTNAVTALRRKFNNWKGEKAD